MSSPATVAPSRTGCVGVCTYSGYVLVGVDRARVRRTPTAMPPPGFELPLLSFDWTVVARAGVVAAYEFEGFLQFHREGLLKILLIILKVYLRKCLSHRNRIKNFKCR